MLKKCLFGTLVLFMLSATLMAGGKPFDVTVSFKPGEKPHQLEFNVVLKDAKTQAVLFAPKVITNQGEPAKASSLDKEGREFTFSVSFDEGGKSGKYEVIVTKDGKEIQKDQGVFTSK
jgi:hypothetical protein